MATNSYYHKNHRGINQTYLYPQLMLREPKNLHTFISEALSLGL